MDDNETSESPLRAMVLWAFFGAAMWGGIIWLAMCIVG